MLFYAKQATLPERRLEDVVERGLNLVVGHIDLANETEDGGVEGRHMALPLVERPFAFVGLFAGDSAGPCRGVC